jgi:hypothetical protein
LRDDYWGDRHDVRLVACGAVWCCAVLRRACVGEVVQNSRTEERSVGWDAERAKEGVDWWWMFTQHLLILEHRYIRFARALLIRAR